MTTAMFSSTSAIAQAATMIAAWMIRLRPAAIPAFNWRVLAFAIESDNK